MSNFSYTRIWLLVALTCTSLLVVAQKAKPRKPKPAPAQGICGTVVEKQGDFMPGPDKPVPKGKPVVREVVIYPALTLEQVRRDEEGFITEVPGIAPVRTVKSDKQGKFCAYKLPAGRYSVLIREPKGLFGNQFDGQNHINPETVNPRKVTRTTLEITHGAAF